MHHCVLFLLLFSTTATAFKEYQTRIPNGDKVKGYPGVGHISSNGGGKRNEFGLDFNHHNQKWTKELCFKDSDGDGLTNGMELGDPDCVWTEGTTPTFDKGIRHPGVAEGDSTQHDSCATFIDPPPFNTTRIRFNFSNHPVSAIDTKYVCAPMQFPSGKRWIKRFSANIQHPSVVHHILIYACDKKIKASSMNCLDMASSCPIILYAWAVGAKDFCLPSNLGFPVGIEGMTHMVMEIHYDNPKRQENLRDSSGVDFILTDIAPVHEAGMLMLGDPGVLSVGSSIAPAIKGLRIPPNEKHYDYYNTCPSSCTDKQITDDQPLTVVATFAHGHQSAVSLQLDRVPKGKTDFVNESDILFSSPHFDFDLQQIKPLPVSQYKTIHKGDALRMHCKYDTRNKQNVVTVGGEASSQEMCLGFLVYYPRLPSFPMCLGVTARDMPNHASSFAACGVHEKGGLYSYPSCKCCTRSSGSFVLSG